MSAEYIQPCIEQQVKGAIEADDPSALANLIAVQALYGQTDVSVDNSSVANPVLRCLLRQCEREIIVDGSSSKVVIATDGGNKTTCKKWLTLNRTS